MSKKNAAKQVKSNDAGPGPTGLYRCPNDECKHSWRGTLNFNIDCPKCGETQGPVAVV